MLIDRECYRATVRPGTTPKVPSARGSGRSQVVCRVNGIGAGKRKYYAGAGSVGEPVDAWCYYGFDPAVPYDPDHCFLYSPPVAQLMLLVRSVLPFEAFYTALRVVEMIALALIAGPAIGPALLIPAVAIEINAANVNLLVVGAVLLGFRHPWAWAFVILTKATPGIGLLWFAVRREWRNLAIAVVATATVAAASFLIAPWMWGDYLTALRGEPDASLFTIWVRAPIAALVVIWGARTDRRWAVVVAVFLTMPRWYFLSPVILIGLFSVVRLPRPLPWMALGRRPIRASRPQAVAATTAAAGRTFRAPSS